MCQLMASINIWWAVMPQMRANQNRMNWRCASNSEKDDVMRRLSRQCLVAKAPTKSPWLCATRGVCARGQPKG
jgi:hypothetical protein